MKAMFACLSGSPPAENGPIRTDYVAYNDVSARGCSSAGRALESHSRGQGFESPQLHTLRDFSGDPDRQANIAFALIVLGIIFVGGLTIWLFYGAQF